MELYEVMRTTFAARQFSDDPVPDAILHRILDNARFASSGGNRQGGHVIVIRDEDSKRAISRLGVPAAKRYAAQRANGENPWNPLSPARVSDETIFETAPPAILTETLAFAPVLLIVCIDLEVVAATDQDLERVGLVSGGSIYPFAWNILLAARNEGYGGTLTTLPIAQEHKLQELLEIPEQVAVAAVIPFGKPIRQLTKLKRRTVDEFTHLERWHGGSLAL